MILLSGAYVLIVLARVPELIPFLAPLQLGKITFALGALMVLATRTERLLGLWKDIPFGRMLLLLACIAVCGIPFSVWRGGAFNSLLGFAKTLAGFFLVVALTEHGREKALRFFIMASVAALAALLAFDTGTGRLHVSDTYDPNDMALLFVVFLPIVTAEALCARNFLLRIAAWGTVACSLIGIALTQSRGGLLALAAVAAHALIISKKRRWLLVPLLALGAVIILQAADDALWSRFGELRDQSDYNYSGRTGRLTMWEEGLKLFAQRPLLGVGIGQFSAGVGMLGNGTYKTAHNSFVQLGAELGLVGLLAFLAILRDVYRIARAGASPALPSACRIRHSALMLALTGYCVGGFFLSQAYGNILYMLLALAAIMHLERNRLEHPASLPARQKALVAGPSAPASEPAPAEANSLMRRADAVRKARQELLRRGKADARLNIHSREESL